MKQRWTATKLAAERVKLKMSRAALADAVGVCERTITRWESGERSPRPLHEIRLDAVLSPSLRGSDSLMKARVLVEVTEVVRAGSVIAPELISRLRAVLGLSQAGMARAVGCYEKTITRWERGVQVPDERGRKELLAIAEGEASRMRSTRPTAIPKTRRTTMDLRKSYLNQMPVTLPLMFSETLSYKGPSRWVCFYYDRGNGMPAWYDGRVTNTDGHGESAWRMLMRHPVFSRMIGSCNLGSDSVDATHCLVVDRLDRRLYVAPLREGRAHCTLVSMQTHPVDPDLFTHADYVQLYNATPDEEVASPVMEDLAWIAEDTSREFRECIQIWLSRMN